MSCQEIKKSKGGFFTRFPESVFKSLAFDCAYEKVLHEECEKQRQDVVGRYEAFIAHSSRNFLMTFEDQLSDESIPKFTNLVCPLPWETDNTIALAGTWQQMVTTGMYLWERE